MFSRFTSASLAAALVFAAPFTLVGAKPPDLPVKKDVECRDSAPQPVPVTAPAPYVTTPAPFTLSKDVPPVPRATVVMEKMVTKVYPVADLVIPLEKAKSGNTAEDRLMELIMATVTPASWAAKGGIGTMEYYPLTLSVVVSQSPEVQEQIADLLSSMRRMQDTQVAVEVRFVSVAEEFWKQTCLDCEKCTATCTTKSCPTSEECRGKSSSVRFLNDIQLFLLMEALQADARTNVMQAPKITVFNRQTSTISITDEQLFATNVTILYGPNGSPILVPTNTPINMGGSMLTIQSVISADKRFVRLSVDAKLTTPDRDKVPLIPITIPVTPVMEDGTKGEPVTFTQFLQQPKFNTLSVDKTFTVPDGDSALLDMGKREHEVTGGYRPPVLRAIPYVKRLFPAPPHMETEHVLMVVTPRIVIDEVEETGVAKTDLKSMAKVMPPADAEEQEELASGKKCTNCCDKCPECCKVCCQKCQDCCENCAQCCHGKAAELVEKYHRACAEGHGDMATKLAVQALAIDPMCFSKSRTEPASKGH